MATMATGSGKGKGSDVALSASSGDVSDAAAAVDIKAEQNRQKKMGRNTKKSKLPHSAGSTMQDVPRPFKNENFQGHRNSTKGHDDERGTCSQPEQDQDSYSSKKMVELTLPGEKMVELPFDDAIKMDLPKGTVVRLPGGWVCLH